MHGFIVWCRVLHLLFSLFTLRIFPASVVVFHFILEFLKHFLVLKSHLLHLSLYTLIQLLFLALFYLASARLLLFPNEVVNRLSELNDIIQS